MRTSVFIYWQKVKLSGVIPLQECMKVPTLFAVKIDLKGHGQRIEGRLILRFLVRIIVRGKDHITLRATPVVVIIKENNKGFVVWWVNLVLAIATKCDLFVVH